MAESIKFYSELMGFEIDCQFMPKPGIEITLMKGQGETMVELIKDAIHDAGFYSIGLDVDDLDGALYQFKLSGAQVLMEPVPITVGKLAFIEDPNGVRIALIQHQ